MNELIIKIKNPECLRGVNKIINNLRYVLIPIGLLYAAYIIFLESKNLSSYHLSIDRKYFLFAFIILGINQILFTMAWHFIVLTISENANLKDNTIAFSEAQIAKILPSPIFYIISRVTYYKSSQLPMKEKSVVISIIMETSIQLLSGLLLIGILSTIKSNSINISIIIWFVFTVTLTIILYQLFILVIKKFIKLRKNNIKILALTCLLTTTTWFLSLPFSQYIIQGLFSNMRVDISFWISIWKIWILSSLVSYIGTAVGGLGVLREFSMVIMLAQELNMTYAIIIALVSRLLITLSNIFWSTIILILARKITKLKYLVKGTIL
ncbi:MAG: hypothetical protein KatS3mg046_676 [Bellilinea sp.]|nr:MAG: hypothetical protein KatS3mg046_676 [Bellilinea sp.]